MVNVPPPLLCSTPPPIDFGEEDDDSGLQSTLNLDEADDEFSDYGGLVTETRRLEIVANDKVSVPHLMPDLEIPQTDFTARPPDPENCYVSCITPPPLSTITTDIKPKNLKQQQQPPVIEAFNFDVTHNFSLDAQETQDFGSFQQQLDNDMPSNVIIEGVDVDGDGDDEEATNNDNVPSLKLDSLSLYSSGSGSVSSAALSPAMPLDDLEGQTKSKLYSAGGVGGGIVHQVTLEDVSDDSGDDDYSPKKRKSLIVNEDSEDFFAIHIVDDESTKQPKIARNDIMHNNDDDDEDEMQITVEIIQPAIDCHPNDCDEDDDDGFAAFQTTDFESKAMTPPLSSFSSEVVHNNYNNNEVVVDDDDDDFGDFADFSLATQSEQTSVPVANQTTLEAKHLEEKSEYVTQHAADINKDNDDGGGGGDNDFDDFQDFAKPSTNNDYVLSTTTVPKPPAGQTINSNSEANNDINNADADDDDDDDFGDFSEASFASAAVAPPPSVTKPNIIKTVVPPPPPPAATNIGITERVKPVLEMMFPSAATATSMTSDPSSSTQTSCVPTIKDNMQFSAIEQAKALDYQWTNSEMRFSLIRSLGIDSRNILFCEKWNSNMPRFAANLSFDPIKPMKPQSAAAGGSTIMNTTSSLASVGGMSRSTMLNPTSHMSTDDFDWKNGSVNPMSESHVQTLQLEQLDQLMMVANDDKINLDSSNYSYSSSTTCVTTTTTTLTTSTSTLTTSIPSTITDTMMTMIMDDDVTSTTTTLNKISTTINEMSSKCELMEQQQRNNMLPLDIFGLVENQTNTCTKSKSCTTITNNNNNNNETDCSNVALQQSSSSPQMIIIPTTTSTTTITNQHQYQQQQLVDGIFGISSNANETHLSMATNNITNDTIIPFDNKTFDFTATLKTNQTNNNKRFGGGDSSSLTNLDAFLDCRNDTIQSTGTEIETKSGEFYGRQQEQHQEEQFIAANDEVIDVIVVASKDDDKNNDDSDYSNRYEPPNDDATTKTSTDVIATTATTISPTLSTDSNGHSLDNIAQHPVQSNIDLNDEQLLTKGLNNNNYNKTMPTVVATTTTGLTNSLDMTTVGGVMMGNNNILSHNNQHVVGGLGLAGSDQYNLGCDLPTQTPSAMPTMTMTTTTYNVPLKETHIFTPSKSDTAIAKTTTTTTTPPIDFDYEIAAAGIIIDETVVKKEYRDIEYKPPYDLEMMPSTIKPTSTSTVGGVGGGVTNIYLDPPQLKADDIDDDDDFSDFQSVPVQKTQDHKIVNNSVAPTFGDQMILSPAILLPQAISLKTTKKPSIEWGDSANTNINPDELARIEELFPQPKIAGVLAKSKENSNQGSPVHQQQEHSLPQAPTISAAVAHNHAEASTGGDDDDWSDFVSVPITSSNGGFEAKKQQIINNNNNNRNTKTGRMMMTMGSSLTNTGAGGGASGDADEWSDFVSSAPPVSIPQYNSSAWQKANFYNNPMSLYQHNQQHAHSNLVPNSLASTKYQLNNNNNNNKHNNNSNNHHLNANRIITQQKQQQQQKLQKIHIMHDFSTAPTAETSHQQQIYQQQHHHYTQQLQQQQQQQQQRNNHHYQQQQQQRSNHHHHQQHHHQQSSGVQYGNAKVTPRISLIPDLSFMAPALPTNAGAFMSSLPKPTFSSKK